MLCFLNNSTTTDTTISMVISSQGSSGNKEMCQIDQTFSVLTLLYWLNSTETVLEATEVLRSWISRCISRVLSQHK